MTRQTKKFLDAFLSSLFTMFMFVTLAKLILSNQLGTHWALAVFYFAATMVGCMWVGAASKRKN